MLEGWIRIQAGSSNNIITGNLIGTNQAGTNARGNLVGIFVTNSTGNTIGGTSAASRNIISGNTVDGIQLFVGANSNLVQGNYIGLDVTGTVRWGTQIRAWRFSAVPRITSLAVPRRVPAT